MTDARPLRFGLIGAGRIAQAAHLPALELMQDATLAIVADPSERLARGVAGRYGSAWTTVTAELLQSELDGVIVCVPDRMHAEIGIAALDAGIAVLMEKPLAPTVADCLALEDAARRAGVPLQPAFMKRHDPAIVYARRLLPTIGPILSARLWYRVMAGTRAAIQRTLFPRMILDPAVQSIEDRYKADGAGYKLMTHGVHQFDLARALLGEVSWLSSHAASFNGDFTWHGTMGLAGGGLASFEVTASVHSQWSEGVEIYGERGHIRVRSPYVFSKLGSQAEVFIESEAEGRRPVFGDTNPFGHQLQTFARAVRGRSSGSPTPADGTAATRLVLAVAESAAADGRRVAP